MRVTVKEFADKQGITTIEANGTLKFLEKRGVAKVVDHRKPESGKGRASSVYEVNESATGADIFQLEVSA